MSLKYKTLLKNIPLVCLGNRNIGTVIKRSSKHLSTTSTKDQIRNQDDSMYVFDRKTKTLQRKRAAEAKDVDLYDYIKDEVGFRLADRIFDIKRKFKLAADIGCSRGYVSKHIPPEFVEEIILCDTNQANLDAIQLHSGLKYKKQILDEEHIEFEPNSLDLVVSSLSLHWVNDLPGAFKRILQALKQDGVLLAAVFGGDTLYELRSSLQLAEMERKGGISPHISPFTEIRDIGNLMSRAGFAMLTIDTDELIINYPSMFELMWDLKGMAENNAALNRSLHLNRDTQFAASAIYQEMYGKYDRETNESNVPATFQIIYMVGWKPDPTQPKPSERGSGEVSLKDLHRLDEIVKDIKKFKQD
ncbi:arginine-hydroxylase NDUFAF5, mitochondrial [Agrilus planipennis]|uniref:Arginine-hydroxylase NDUFAF5, mitochondrial n=1 Tax=Agrilus planipennis TaxID=224129 RepID=A0A1W4W7L8_AGRPL|nr:arginine-hydroxylase NDUFAF5, mitochondrial [Agrilus planipennis]XP_025829344.1 arginine-hydroxylase NDUFAF5, mitochondrial [Agrilus planipennis]